MEKHCQQHTAACVLEYPREQQGLGDDEHRKGYEWNPTQVLMRKDHERPMPHGVDSPNNYAGRHGSESREEARQQVAAPAQFLAGRKEKYEPEGGRTGTTGGTRLKAKAP